MKKWIAKNTLLSIVIASLIFIIFYFTVDYIANEVFNLPRRLLNIFMWIFMFLGGLIISYKILYLSNKNNNNNFRTIDKIIDCSLPVLKKYLPKMILYPFIILYGYKGIIYIIKNDIELTYEIISSNLSIIIIIVILIKIIIRFINYEYRTNNYQISEEDIITDERIIKIKAYHEAGHYVVAKLLNMPIKEVNIINTVNSGGQLILDLPGILTFSQIKNLVMIKYAGHLSEKIFNEEVSDGCMGSENSDITTANQLLRKYVFLTDNSLSLTGFERDKIDEKCICLSKKWEKEAEEILILNREEVITIAEELIEKKIIKIIH